MERVGAWEAVTRGPIVGRWLSWDLGLVFPAPSLQPPLLLCLAACVRVLGGLGRGLSALTMTLQFRGSWCPGLCLGSRVWSGRGLWNAGDSGLVAFLF